MSYSTKKITTTLLDELKNALHKVDYGSIEIFVQESVVTQITVRNIKKTSYKINSSVTAQVKTASGSKITSFAHTNTPPKIRVLTLKKE